MARGRIDRLESWSPAKRQAKARADAARVDRLVTQLRLATREAWAGYRRRKGDGQAGQEDRHWLGLVMEGLREQSRLIQLEADSEPMADKLDRMLAELRAADDGGMPIGNPSPPLGDDEGSG
jgi:hypothetical protein